jgi:hypothetical protein
MKNFISVFFQSLLFLLVFFAGSIFPPFHIQRVLIVTPTVTHLFVADGLLLMLSLYVVILCIQAMTKRLRGHALWTTVALVVAALAGLLMKFGYVTRDM